MEFPKDAQPLLSTTELILSRLKLPRERSLRNVERVLTTLASMPNLNNRFSLNIEVAIGTMAVLKVLLPSAYQRIRLSSDFKFLAEECFQTTIGEFDRHSELIVLNWRAFQDFNGLTDQEKEELRQHSSPLSPQDWHLQLRKAANKYLEVFDLSNF